MRVRDAEHIVAAVDRNDNVAIAQEAAGKHATQLAKTNDNDLTHAISRNHSTSKFNREGRKGKNLIRE
jgi:hypothetical protein